MSQVVRTKIEALVKLIADYDTRFALAKKEHKKAVAKGAYTKMDAVFEELRIERIVSYVPAKRDLREAYHIGTLETQILSGKGFDFFRADGFVEAVRNLETEGLITVTREPGDAMMTRADIQKVMFSERYPNTLIERVVHSQPTPGHGHAQAICPKCVINLLRDARLHTTEVQEDE